MLLMFFFNRGICIFLLGLWLCVDCVQYIYSTKYLGFLLLVDSFAVTNWHWYQLVAFKETTNKIFTVLLYTVMVYAPICLWFASCCSLVVYELYILCCYKFGHKNIFNKLQEGRDNRFEMSKISTTIIGWYSVTLFKMLHLNW